MKVGEVRGKDDGKRPKATARDTTVAARTNV